MRNESSAEGLEQQERKHNGNQVAIADENHNAHEANEKGIQSHERKQRNDSLLGSRRVGMNRNTVGISHCYAGVEERVQAHDQSREQDYGKDPERQLVAVILVPGELGQKAVQYGDSKWW